MAEHQFRFHCAVFFVSLSSLSEAMLMASRHFNFPFRLDPTRDVVRSHVFLFGFSCAPFDIIDPVLSFVLGLTRVVGVV